MKELSIEEKAKRYDEAIAKGKQIQNTPYTAHWDIMKEVAEHLLPELKESEDEKIIKSVTRLVKAFYDVNFPTPEGFTREELVSWLEKRGQVKDFTLSQHENKTSKENNDFLTNEDEKIRQFLIHEVTETSDEIMSYRNMNKKDVIAWLEKQGEKDKEILVLKDQIESLHAAIKALKEAHKIELEKQREQKPAEKFPKYEKGDVLTDGKNKYEVLSWDYTETGIAAYYMKGVGYKFSWSCEEADKKLHIVEKKSAWSEEDEIRLKHILRLLDVKDDKKYLLMFGLNSLQDLKKDIDWLKPLKNRVQQQPKQEWSEEDERNIGKIIEILHYTEKTSSIEPISLYSKEINWLKSLKEKYTWKPSDEQMKALEDAIEFLGCTKKVREDLKSLYEQLKKTKRLKL